MRSLPTRCLPPLLLLAALFGCATSAPPPDPVALPVVRGTAQPVWQRVRFSIHWNRQEAPAWHIDALLAHRVAGPALAQERRSIELWRFHRRAADDAAGHSLSFLSYAAKETNTRICQTIEADPRVKEMIAAGLVDKVACEAFPEDRAFLVEASSDQRWPLAVQRSWPYYIMGVSEMWLRLIDENLPPRNGQPETLEQSSASYETANRTVTETWQNDGEHALLHHLSGIFGYEEIRITEKKLHRF